MLHYFFETIFIALAVHPDLILTASTGNAHSLARTINPPTASLVSRYGVVQSYKKEMSIPGYHV